jgi:DNA invertase Pin-like site-specific DNA recombinase
VLVAVGQRVGYVRVSTVDQNPERQLEGVALDRVFTDKASGKDTKRPELDALLAYVRDGDTVVVHSMDRLARNLEDLRRLVRELTGRGVRVEFVKEAPTFTREDTPMATLLLSMMGAVAEFERALIRERQREGIALAKRRGVYKGGKRRLDDAKLGELKALLDVGVSKSAAARRLGISRRSVYRYLGAMDLGESISGRTVQPSQGALLGSMLAKVTPENRHDRVDWRNPVGREV